MLSEGGQQLSQLIASADLTVRLRALSLAVSLAATSPEAAAAIRQKGRLLMSEAAECSYKLPHGICAAPRVLSGAVIGVRA